MTVIRVILDTDFMVNHPGLGPVFLNALKHETLCSEIKTIAYFSC